VFVEMLYSLIDFQNEDSVYDLLVGYFRNDTLNQKTELTLSLGSVPFHTYDFTKLIGGVITGISQDTVNNQVRARWHSNCSGGTFNGYIEGIGGTSGFYPVKSGNINLGQGYHINLCGDLTCFSVCGETLYPNYVA